MNYLGSKGTPFIFLVDYEMKKTIISTDIEHNTDILFDINGFTNAPNTARNKTDFSFSKFPMSESVYTEGFEQVKKEIQRGNSFLLNLTYPTRLETDLTVEDIFGMTRAKYKICLKDSFVCFSPEIFVKIDDGRISSYPMKGTIDASIENAEEKILADGKEIAEHYTIVDLIRNDLSRVAKNVKVDRFRYIDTLKTTNKTLLQVSSEISGRLPEDYASNIGSILYRLLPAGSISGAPKAKTIKVIRNAEGQDRGYYTGICGYFDGKNLDSGVMIRFVEQRDKEQFYRSGCGITSLSKAKDEYSEMIDKVYLPLVKKDNG